MMSLLVKQLDPSKHIKVTIYTFFGLYQINICIFIIEINKKTLKTYIELLVYTSTVFPQTLQYLFFITDI